MVIDLRSDTITLPSKEMIDAIVESFNQGLFGDDVYGEDKVVNRLEERAAEMFGKEAALFVTSGTQGNLVSVLSHTSPGDEIILEADSHIFWYEVGGFARIGGLSVWTVQGTDGYIRPEQLRESIRARDIHCPPTTLACLENTHNRAGGKVITKDQMGQFYDEAKSLGLNVHVDGARIFNAAIAQNLSVAELAARADSVMFCLSKGLSAPVGSLVVGSSKFINKARKFRKMLGGGMRQAGVIAAAGLWALENMVDRLAEDHENAQFLAASLSKLDGISIIPPDSNIVVFDFKTLNITSDEFIVGLKKKGILFTKFGKYSIRAVTHRHVNRADMEKVITAVKEYLESRS